MFCGEKGVSGEPKLVIAVRASGRVLEIDRKAHRFRLDQKIEFAGDTERPRKERDAEMALPLGQPVLAETPALFQGFERGLGDLALLHFERGLPVKSHHVLIEGNPPAVGVLLEIRDPEVAGDFHLGASSRADR